MVAHIDNPNIQGQESYVLNCSYIKHHVKVASFLKQMEESISNVFRDRNHSTCSYFSQKWKNSNISMNG